MKNKILLTESEKERILGLHKKAIKESRLNEEGEDDSRINQSDPYDYKFDGKYLKGTSAERMYTSDPKNYPDCVRKMGTPIVVTSGNLSSRYAIKGTGSAKFLATGDEISFDKFYFFPIPYYSKDVTLVQQNNKPEAYNSINKQYEEYFCSTNNQIQIGDVTYVPISKPSSPPKPQRTIPTTGDQLLKGGTYLMLKDKNDLVTKVQSQLIYAGENVQNTGTFDQQTKDAVKSYQGRNNLKPDGIVGKLTWGKLSKVLPYSDEIMARKEATHIPTSSTPKEVVPPTPSQPVAQDNTSVEY